MRLSILLFSPNGTTLIVGEKLKAHLQEKSIDTQIVDITGKAAFFNNHHKADFFKEKLDKHDFLIIGSPVYSHHMQQNMIQAIQALPEPGNGYSTAAGLYVTYGGISSGQALYDAARLLEVGGRKPLVAMKINSFHSASRQFSRHINTGLPGLDEEKIIRQMADEIAAYMNGKMKQETITSRLNYQNLRNRLVDTFFREGPFSDLIMPRVKYDNEKCTLCGDCVENCPVQRIELGDNGITINRTIACIHCSNCQISCPTQAIRHDMSPFEDMMIKASHGKGLISSNEKPPSQLFAV